MPSQSRLSSFFFEAASANFLSLLNASSCCVLGFFRADAFFKVLSEYEISISVVTRRSSLLTSGPGTSPLSPSADLDYRSYLAHTEWQAEELGKCVPRRI